MRCIKTGCAIQCGDTQFHGDLFVTGHPLEFDSFSFILKGVPQIAGVFGSKDAPFKIDASASDLTLEGTYGSAIKYGQFEVHNFKASDSLLAYLEMWELPVYYFLQGETNG